MVVWLYDALESRFGPQTRALMNGVSLWVAPIVRLELAYLTEMKRVQATPHAIMAALGTRIGLAEATATPLSTWIDWAVRLSWTRDPFDRLITAQAMHHDATRITADQCILQHYKRAQTPAC